MKYILAPVLITTVLTTGCASNPSQPVHYPKGFKEPESMHRTEVIQATRQCINAKMKPNIEYLAVKTDQGRVITPINVHCDGTY
jgi:PBP1b-binding outer membrane lipoprotein LpoB